MAGEMEMRVDFTQYNAAVNRLASFDRVKAKHIDAVFANANKIAVHKAKSVARRSKHGAYSLQYESRTHKAGYLRANIAFRVSKKYRLVYSKLLNLLTVYSVRPKSSGNLEILQVKMKVNSKGTPIYMLMIFVPMFLS